ncbi:MAG: 3'-5' exonuclease [Patescibacteria group bacterium]
MDTKSFFKRPLAITDVETTGLDVRRHEIIEIGLVLVDQETFEIKDTLDIKVIPTHLETADPKSFLISGFRPDHWPEAIPLKDAMTQYSAKTEGAVFASWNITFDWQFIEEAFRTTRVRDGIDYHRIDLPTIAWLKLRNAGLEKISLKEICKLYGIEPEPSPHRGINGAMKAYEVLKKLI